MATLSDKFGNNCTGRVVSGQLNNTTNPVTFSIGASDLIDPAGVTLAAPFTMPVWNDSLGQNPSSDPNMELLYVTSRTGTSLTANRGAEGTTIVAHAGTPKVMVGITAGYMNLLGPSVTTKTSTANVAVFQALRFM